MYRRSDPRWNRTFQNLTSNIEHANESAQENLYGFTQRYVNPCLSSITDCLNTCTAPCFPAHNDRARRHRRSVRGRAEVSFDFYDDWEEDESDGLLGWGTDNLDRFLGGASTYGATSNQPGRQQGMTYGQRNRDSRFNATRRKSNAQARDVAGQDPTIIPSSSYFGFLGRLPFKIGGKGLRYKPSAADLTDHPGQTRRSLDEEQPLIEDSDEEALEGRENKGHRRQRSDTHASGHTTDSLSSRGDIFPSEDELDDAVPLDDEFTLQLERRTTGQWKDDDASSNANPGRGKRPVGTRGSTRSVSSRSTRESGTRKSEEGALQQPMSGTIEEVPTLDELQKEEERLRIEEEQEVERKRQEAQQLAVRRGLVAKQQLRTPSIRSTSSRQSLSPLPTSQMTTVQSKVSPLLRSPASEHLQSSDMFPFPAYVDAQTMPDSSAFHVDESDYSSMAPTPNRPLSLKDHPQEEVENEAFVPARLPNFGSGK